MWAAMASASRMLRTRAGAGVVDVVVDDLAPRLGEHLLLEPPALEREAERRDERADDRGDHATAASPIPRNFRSSTLSGTSPLSARTLSDEHQAEDDRGDHHREPVEEHRGHERDEEAEPVAAAVDVQVDASRSRTGSFVGLGHPDSSRPQTCENRPTRHIDGEEAHLDDLGRA